MAGAESKPHFSKAALNLGEKLQDTRIGKWARHSDSPAAKYLRWFHLPDVDRDAIDWAEVPGDLRVKKRQLPREWKNAAILSTDSDEFDRLAAQANDDYGADRWARDAVLYEANGVVRIGINPNPEHHGVFGYESIEGSISLTVAMRLGRGPLRAAMGLYRPDENALYTPSTAPTVVTPSIPNAEIPDRYPHMPLAC